MAAPVKVIFTATYAWWFIPVMYVFLGFCILLDVCPDNRLCDWLLARGTLLDVAHPDDAALGS